jgi:hypothetical protein
MLEHLHLLVQGTSTNLLSEFDIKKFICTFIQLLWIFEHFIKFQIFKISFTLLKIEENILTCISYFEFFLFSDILY